MRLVFTALVMLAGCQDQRVQTVRSDFQAGIIGGSKVTSSDTISKVTVRVQRQVRDGYNNCSGTLIAAHSVLTASHCVGEFEKPVRILFFDGSYANVTSYVTHPKADPKLPSGQLDFAIVNFDGPDITSLAMLPTRDSKLDHGEKLMIAGYGDQAPDGGPTDELYMLPVTVNDPTFSESEVTVDEGDGIGACYGDSGGPLYRTENDGTITLLGVDSFGIGPKCGTLEAYSNPVVALDWISEVLAHQPSH